MSRFLVFALCAALASAFQWRKERKNALLTVCFRSKASPKFRTAAQLDEGCVNNIASFKMARPDADVIIIAPTLDMVSERIKKISAFDPSVRIITVGTGPWEINGQKIPFTGTDGRFFGSGLNMLWYTQVLLHSKEYTKYDYIFVADGADVFFQRDPFELTLEHPSADLIFFGDRNDKVNKGIEQFRRMMPLCTNNTHTDPELLDAVQEAFKQPVMMSATGNHVTYGVYANSGLILGKSREVVHFISKVAETAAQCHFWKSDQSMVNLVRYHELKRLGADKVIIFPDMNKTVSMGKYLWRHFTSDGWVASKIDREKLYVVHQYDRSPMKTEVATLLKLKMEGWLTDHEKCSAQDCSRAAQLERYQR